MERVLVLSDDTSWREALTADLRAAGHQAQALSFASFSGQPRGRFSGVTAAVVDHRAASSAEPRPGFIRQQTGGARTYVLAVFTPAQLPQLDFSPGFDDFLVDPCTGAQVVARARQLRWRENRADAADLLQAGDLLINTASCEVTLRGVPLSLTYQEYQLLRHLVSHRGRVFTREQLLSELWGYNYYGGTRTVDVHIRRLRAKLGPDYEDLIQTVRNVGYRFARDP